MGVIRFAGFLRHSSPQRHGVSPRVGHERGQDCVAIRRSGSAHSCTLSERHGVEGRRATRDDEPCAATGAPHAGRHFVAERHRRRSLSGIGPPGLRRDRRGAPHRARHDQWPGHLHDSPAPIRDARSSFRSHESRVGVTLGGRRRRCSALGGEHDGDTVSGAARRSTPASGATAAHGCHPVPAAVAAPRGAAHATPRAGRDATVRRATAWRGRRRREHPAERCSPRGARRSGHARARGSPAGSVLHSLPHHVPALRSPRRVPLPRTSLT